MGVEPRADFRHEPPPGAAAQAVAPLITLLTLEAAARAAATSTELVHLIATEWRKLVAADQIFVFQCKARRAVALAASSQSTVDRASPLIIDLEAGFTRHLNGGEAGKVQSVEMGSLLVAPSAVASEYAFPHFCVAPLKLSNGDIFALVALARDRAWSEQDFTGVERIASAYAHAWRALDGDRRLSAKGWKRHVVPAVAVALLVAAVIPVPLTALAPVEVVGRDPEVVGAPIDGVIRRIDVDPNGIVKKGDLLITFVDTTLRGRASVAEQNVQVASARERRLTQSAFNDRAARRELAVAQAELGLAQAENEAAKEALERSVVRAGRDGVAVYQNRSDLEGKPVSTGERLMAIADPAAVEYRIELPVKDAIVAREGAGVRIYLDADPLKPLDASLEAVSFHAAPVAGGQIAFVLRAAPEAGGVPPRIGFRGTAQVYGHTVPLGYYLLRRPLTMLRQTVGL